VDGLQAEFGDRIAFQYLNVNAEGRLAFDQLGLRGHPGIVVFDASGQEVYRTFGVIEEAALHEKLTSIVDENR
jgi:hypothetical protein